MKIEQITTTRLVAEEGKVLRRVTDGMIAGKTFSLGYDYYDAGVGLAHPYAARPEDFEEVDMPDYEAAPVIDQVKRLQRTSELIQQNIQEMNSLALSAADALAVQSWYPILYETENYMEGDTITMNAKVQYDGRLYAARQTHTITRVYAPSLDTAALWVEVTEDYVDGKETGTLENPIAYTGNMILEVGKYYEQYEIVYLCTRDSGNPVYHDLQYLVGLYVEVA